MAGVAYVENTILSLLEGGYSRELPELLPACLKGVEEK